MAVVKVANFFLEVLLCCIRVEILQGKLLPVSKTQLMVGGKHLPNEFVFCVFAALAVDLQMSLGGCKIYSHSIRGSDSRWYNVIILHLLELGE